MGKCGNWCCVSQTTGVKHKILRLFLRYLFNPLTVASCLGRPTSLLTNCAILFAVQKAIEKKHLNAVVALALASYLSLYPVLLLPPIVLLCHDQEQEGSTTEVGLSQFAIKTMSSFFGVIGILLAMSYLITGASWEFLASTYGVHLLLTDLTPNTGLWWYFFIEMFDSFREFFLGVFWLHLGGYVGGLSIRIRKQPLFVITTVLGVFAIFKPYPSVSDTSLYLSLLPLYRHVFPRKSSLPLLSLHPRLTSPVMRYTFFAVATLLYATLLGPAFYYLWIYAGSGNANFFYAITLVWSLGLSVIVADSIWAVLRDEWEVERPEMKDKFVKQI